MIIVVREDNPNDIIFNSDAWINGSYEAAYAEIKERGFQNAREEITPMGNMIIWVK